MKNIEIYFTVKTMNYIDKARLGKIFTMKGKQYVKKKIARIFINFAKDNICKNIKLFVCL